MVNFVTISVNVDWQGCGSGRWRSHGDRGEDQCRRPWDWGCDGGAGKVAVALGLGQLGPGWVPCDGPLSQRLS